MAVQGRSGAAFPLMSNRPFDLADAIARISDPLRREMCHSAKVCDCGRVLIEEQPGGRHFAVVERCGSLLQFLCRLTDALDRHVPQEDVCGLFVSTAHVPLLARVDKLVFDAPRTRVV